MRQRPVVRHGGPSRRTPPPSRRKRRCAECRARKSGGGEERYFSSRQRWRNPLPDGSLDFAFSLGVLHHVPDTRAAISEISTKLKPGAPFLIYLYYALDNRPAWYRALWKFSNIFRVVISSLPEKPRLWISQIIAVLVYWPLARLAALVERLGFSAAALPLESYKHRAFYVMRTDAYDRFCTRLEQRFTRVQINDMLTTAGFQDVRFSERVPYWCAVGIKR